jgi:hypothetical protein
MIWLCVEANDAVIFANFRSDRAKQLAEAFVSSAKIENLKYVAMTKVLPTTLDVRVAFPSGRNTKYFKRGACAKWFEAIEGDRNGKIHASDFFLQRAKI